MVATIAALLVRDRWGAAAEDLGRLHAETIVQTPSRMRKPHCSSTYARTARIAAPTRLRTRYVREIALILPSWRPAKPARISSAPTTWTTWSIRQLWRMARLRGLPGPSRPRTRPRRSPRSCPTPSPEFSEPGPLLSSSPRHRRRGHRRPTRRSRRRSAARGLLLAALPALLGALPCPFPRLLPALAAAVDGVLGRLGGRERRGAERVRGKADRVARHLVHEQADSGRRDEPEDGEGGDCEGGTLHLSAEARPAGLGAAKAGLPLRAARGASGFAAPRTPTSAARG